MSATNTLNDAICLKKLENSSRIPPGPSTARREPHVPLWTFVIYAHANSIFWGHTACDAPASSMLFQMCLDTLDRPVARKVSDFYRFWVIRARFQSLSRDPTPENRPGLSKSGLSVSGFSRHNCMYFMIVSRRGNEVCCVTLARDQV